MAGLYIGGLAQALDTGDGVMCLLRDCGPIAVRDILPRGDPGAANGPHIRCREPVAHIVQIDPAGRIERHVQMGKGGRDIGQHLGTAQKACRKEFQKAAAEAERDLQVARGCDPRGIGQACTFGQRDHVGVGAGGEGEFRAGLKAGRNLICVDDRAPRRPENLACLWRSCELFQRRRRCGT